MQIRVALTVDMTHHVDWNTVDEDGEIRAVVGVEATEKNLIGFAAAVMLPDNQPRGYSQNIAGSVGWTKR